MSFLMEAFLFPFCRNNTLIGVGGLKIGSVITNDSNIFNASTTKVFFLSLAFSHPVRNYSHSRYPTPYQGTNKLFFFFKKKKY